MKYSSLSSYLSTVRGISSNSAGLTDVLMVTTSERMLNWLKL